MGTLAHQRIDPWQIIRGHTRGLRDLVLPLESASRTAMYERNRAGQIVRMDRRHQSATRRRTITRIDVGMLGVETGGTVIPNRPMTPRRDLSPAVEATKSFIPFGKPFDHVGDIASLRHVAR